MASDDFLTHSWRERVTAIQADQAQARADLVMAEHNNDPLSAGDAIEKIALYDQRLYALGTIQAQYEASQRPPEPADRRNDVDLTPREAMKVSGLDPDNPDDVDTYNRGWHKLQALKARGHYRE